MRLPSKLYRYSESILSDMVKILSVIVGPIGVYELYKLVKKNVETLDRYVEALDALFLLGKIFFDEKEGMINVNRN